MTHDETTPTVLGLGEMGRALTAALLAAGHPTTVWNRSPGRAATLVEAGATEVRTVGDAVTAGPLVVACLLDHGSVHEVLDPVAADLSGRALVNVTTTTPAQSRELAAWAEGHGIAYLDGGIMAVPEMIGGSRAAIFFSGSTAVFQEHEAVLGRWGEATWFGPDPGLAALYDLAILAGMYLMFAGFLHGAAMVAPAGVSAAAFAELAGPFLSAMTGGLAGLAEVVDGRDYTVAGQQSLEFSDLGDLVQATVDQGVSTEVIAPVHALIRRQIAAGYGKEAFARIYEEIRSGAA
jgi:3-hydroxyisobutyrate dehydrogenase-like beta-hydroxyacid dehydrogenase